MFDKINEGFKKLRKNPKLLMYLGYSAISPLEKSYRYENINYNPKLAPAIYAVWHGWQYGLLGIKGANRKRLHLLVSPNRDGQTIGDISRKLGYSILSGSTGKSGTKALRDIMRIFKEGKDLAYTIDGSRGPIYKVKEGIIKIAQMSQVPIIPMGSDSKVKLEAKSWDKYQMPLFFTKVVNIFGDPIYVPRELDEAGVEEYRLMLENKIIELNKEAKEKIKNALI